MRHDAKERVNWNIVMRPGNLAALDKTNELDCLIDQVRKIKVSFIAKVEDPFRVIKRQLGFVKVRYQDMKKNTTQLKTLFTLSNLWMTRKKLMALPGTVRLKAENGVRDGAKGHRKRSTVQRMPP